MLNLSIDSQKKFISITLKFKEEEEPIKIEGEYSFDSQRGIIKLKELKISKLWLNILASFIKEKEFSIKDSKITEVLDLIL